MIDLTKITPEQANKIECALIMLEKEVETEIATYENLAKDLDLTDRCRSTMRQNAEWWKEVYNLIYKEERNESI